MPHAAETIVATLPAPEPGHSVSGYFRVTGASQSDSSVTGTVDVEFAGETVSTDLVINFSDVIAPAATGYNIPESDPDVDYTVEFGPAGLETR